MSQTFAQLINGKSATVEFSTGSASTPSVAFSGDTNTGIYSPGADQVAISTNGSGRLFVDSNGNVGVGGSVGFGAIDHGIHVTGSGAQEGIRLQTSAGSSGILEVYAESGGATLDTRGSGYIRFNNVATEWARFDSSGRLGIGTSSPADALHVVGKIAVTGTNPSIRQTVQTANLDLCGGTTVGTDSSIQLYGSSSPSDANHTFYNSNVHIWRNAAGSTQYGRFDSSGRLGIGTATPSELLHVVSSGNLYAQFQSNAATDAGFRLQNTSRTWLLFNNGDGRLRFYDSTAGSDRFSIDTSGRLLVGTSTDVSGGDTNAKIEAVSTGPGGIYIGRSDGSTSSGSNLGQIVFSSYAGSTWESAASIQCFADATSGAGDKPGRLVFSTTADGASSPTERMRITQRGYLKTSNSGTYIDTNAAYSEFVTNAADHALWLRNTNGSNPYGLRIDYTLNANDTAKEIIYCVTDTTLKMSLRSNGGITNYQANNVNLCDEREKKNIEKLDSTWDCLKHWELKKFHYNEDADTDDLRYGVIAQQVADYCPEVITEWVKQKAEPAKLDDKGNELEPAKEEIVRMGVKEQQMYWMAIKALQEAQVRIEALEAEVAALKAQ